MWPFSKKDKRAEAAHPVDGEAVKATLNDALVAKIVDHFVSERRWTQTRRFLFGGGSLILFGIYVFFYVTDLGYKVVPNSDMVAVVRITGSIAQGSPTGSADAVIPALSSAFGKPNVKAIVLAIDSGGGQPAEAERIYNYFNAKRDELCKKPDADRPSTPSSVASVPSPKSTCKPIYAVIGNTGASAAYLIAMHADKVYAGKYSLVGSIGAIMQTWDLHKIAQRFDVEHKTYASGTLKGMLDPWTPQTPEAEAKAQSLVASIGKRFADEVRERRHGLLKPDFQYFTGEVWTGEEAKHLGLIDGIDTLDSLIKSTWNVGYHDFGPNKKSGGIGSLLGGFASETVDALVSRRIEQELPPLVR